MCPRSTSVFLALVLLGAACAAPVDPNDALVNLVDDTPSADLALVAPSPADERVYLGDVNHVQLSEEQAWHYGAFDLLPRARVGIALSTLAGDDDTVGFKVYKVQHDGALQLLGVIDGVGLAQALLTTRYGGSFVVESVAGTLPTTLALELFCARLDGKCAPQAQPGESCGSRGLLSCDEGLFCAIAEGCGEADQGGVCERPAEMCPAVAGPTVCGCDGIEYAGACAAHAASVNVRNEGSCVCDPSVYTKHLDEPLDLAGAWIGGFSNESIDGASRLVLNHDGTFNYDQSLSPACLRTDPFCKVQSRALCMSGTWENLGFAVQLHPAATAPNELAQSFTVESTCAGNVRLTTVEQSEEHVLERDPCDGYICGTDEHCELTPVMCIQAPCPAQPSCIAN